jgi:hypothetical protein
MGEANLKRALMAIMLEDAHADGIEYKTYTAAECEANDAAREAALPSHLSPGAIRDRARRAKLKANDPTYLNKEALRKKLIRANNPGMTRAL